MRRKKRRLAPMGFCSCKTPDAKNPGRSRIWNRAGSTGEILLYDEIGNSDYGGIGAKDVAKSLEAMSGVEQITVRINSPGGDVFDGLAIASQLAKHPARIIAEIDGVAASIASHIAVTCDEVRISEAAMMMIHGAWSATVGNAADHDETSALLKKIDGILAKQYAQHTGQPIDRIEAWMSEERWFDSSEAIDFGFANSVIEASDPVQASTRAYVRNRERLAKTKATPQQIAVQLRMMELHLDEFKYNNEPHADGVYRDPIDGLTDDEFARKQSRGIQKLAECN